MIAGKFKATVCGCYTGESAEKKTPFFGIEFQDEKGECIESVFYITENTSARNLKTLLELGYTGKSIADMSDVKKKVSDLFPAIASPIFITVEDETYENDKGETKTKQVVKWVNVGSSGPARFEHAQAVQKFKALSFDGELLRMRGQMVKPVAAKTSSPAAEFTADDVPF